ncbi:TPA: hypothetical protein ACGFB9_004814 [Escherichia coli]
MKKTENFNAAPASSVTSRKARHKCLIACVLCLFSSTATCGTVTIKQPDSVLLESQGFKINFSVPGIGVGAYSGRLNVNVTIGGKSTGLDNFICTDNGNGMSLLSQDSMGMVLSFTTTRVSYTTHVSCGLKKPAPIVNPTSDVMTVRTGTNVNANANVGGGSTNLQITDVAILNYLSKPVSTYNNGVASASLKDLSMTKKGSGVSATYVDAVKQQQVAGGGGNTVKLVTIARNNWASGAAYGVNIRTPTGPLGTYTKPLINNKTVPWDQQQVLTADSRVGLQISNVPGGNSVAGEIIVELAMM